MCDLCVFNLYLTCLCVKQPADCLNGFRVIKSQIQRRARYWSVRDLDWNCVLTSIGVQVCVCVCVLQKMINGSFSFFFFQFPLRQSNPPRKLFAKFKCSLQQWSGSRLADRSASHLQLRTKMTVMTVTRPVPDSKLSCLQPHDGQSWTAFQLSS